jgi:hypothetical protein
VTESHLSTVVTRGDLRESLEAIRDLLAGDADDVTWEKHKAECSCVCGMGDGRTRVAIVKELRAVLEALEALPGGKEATAVDGIVARASAKRDELAARRANRVSVPASS